MIANKVQGQDGVWRSIDAKALYAATVAVSEVYDCLIADVVHRDTGATWSLRNRGERRSPGFEIDGVDDVLLAEFSTRATQVQASLRDLLDEFRATKGRTPSRPEMIRLRQLATRKSRPAKHLRGLSDLLADWRRRAEGLVPESVDHLVRRILNPRPPALRVDDLDERVLRSLATATVVAVMERRSTWTRWNLIAEAARASKTLRVANPADRLQLLDRVAQTAIDEHCLQLTPALLMLSVAAFARPDGASAFRRHHSDVFTSPVILAAEDRLLAAALRPPARGPRLEQTAIARVLQHHASGVALAADQCAAIADDRDVGAGRRRAGRTGRFRQDHHAASTPCGMGNTSAGRARSSGSHHRRQLRTNSRRRSVSDVRTPRNGCTKPPARRATTAAPSWASCARMRSAALVRGDGSQSRGSTESPAICCGPVSRSGCAQGSCSSSTKLPSRAR